MKLMGMLGQSSSVFEGEGASSEWAIKYVHWQW
jgi:hypothetical protein